MELFAYIKGVKKDDPTSVILIEQGEEGKSIAMFEDPAVKPLIESAGHIYDSTYIKLFLIIFSKLNFIILFIFFSFL